MTHQIVISGVGGQGILFITRLLAEAAILKGMSVFTSETHGMAQRGGTVVSHLKIGNFYSPLIRPLSADGLLALKAENFDQHGYFLRKGAWIVVNSDYDLKPKYDGPLFSVNADHLARKIGNPKAVNLILLGFALGVIPKISEAKRGMFCSVEDIKTVLQNRRPKENMTTSAKEKLDASLKAIEAGYNFF
ncbi:MAG: 2-oxoacid:acceptor oxidoreductase family protein [Desulfobacterales bacterium]|nr:2-oxoacid:acceptor oxidoreductase family protein [Desulfobacterales bacterium]